MHALLGGLVDLSAQRVNLACAGEQARGGHKASGASRQRVNPAGGENSAPESLASALTCEVVGLLVEILLHLVVAPVRSGLTGLVVAVHAVEQGQADCGGTVIRRTAK